MLCSLSLYAAIKKRYPDSHITLVAAKTNYEIPFKEINPYIDRVLVFDKSSLKTVLLFYKQLRKIKYDFGIVPSTIVLSRTSHIINFLSGAKKRVGVKSIDGKLNQSHKYLNIKSDFNWKSKHQLIRNLEIARQINCDLTDEELSEIKFSFNADQISFAEKYLADNFPDRSKKIIAFHPGAGKNANIWSTDNFISVIKQLYDQYRNNILITSGWTDSLITEKINSALSENKIPFTILHNCPVKKLGAVLKLCDLYITNDTGTMHIAGFSGAKMVSLFGPTDPAEWVPKGINQISIKSKTGLINDIDVEEVFAHCKLILDK
ncbi:MAG: glycosyltransferase family 9 protein [Ignavibacteriales bacterium]|nr:MAG: glycosyltransferase family 9 protein [Ignavibacteriales bacterium]